MRQFKFLQEAPKFTGQYSDRLDRIYGWNAYETLVMNAYKFCYEHDIEFIGFTQPFSENHIEKLLTVLNMYVDSETHTDIRYRITDRGESIHTLRISNMDLFLIEQHEYV